jgi:hypothetical protein
MEIRVSELDVDYSGLSRALKVEAVVIVAAL